MQVFIFGAGYSGKAVGRAKPEGARVAGTTRSAEKFEAVRQAGIEPFAFDGALTEELAKELAETTHLLVSIAPDEAGDPVLDAMLKFCPSSPAGPSPREERGEGGWPQRLSPPLPVLHGERVRVRGSADVDLTWLTKAMPSLRWIGYLSTVGVYGDHGGAWVDETGECKPVSRRSVMRLEAEQDWLELGRETGLPVAVLRLSGIYGPGRNAFVNLENGTAKRLIKPDQVFNRIHGEDIAGAVWHLAGRNLGGVFNVTDDLPAPPQDVVTYAAGLMGVTPPAEIPFETAQLSPMARTFYGENKRVANAAIKAAGYRFRYPDYRAAFDAMWAARNWKHGEARSPMKAK